MRRELSAASEISVGFLSPGGAASFCGGAFPHDFCFLKAGGSREIKTATGNIKI